MPPGLPEARGWPRQRFLALDRLYGTRLKMRTLNKIGLTLGADVPFCLQGGTMLAQHIGELLTPVPELPDCFIVLAKPRRGFLPRRRIIYAIPRRICARRIGWYAGRLLSEDLESIGRLAGNVFEQVIDVPERVRIKALMREYGTLGCCMSGSGPTVFGLFDTHQAAQSCAEHLRSVVPDVFICRPVEEGCVVTEEATR